MDSTSGPPDLNAVALACRSERALNDRQAASPACVDIFRRAFAGDGDAWTAIWDIFNPLMRRWAGYEPGIDPDDVLQEGFLHFSRYAPQRPSLLATDLLNPVLAYLRMTIQSDLIKAHRREQRRLHEVAWPTHSFAPEQELPLADPAAAQSLAAVDTRLALLERVHQLIKTDAEWLVFEHCLVRDLPPRTLLSSSSVFATIEELYATRHRLIRQLRRDPVIRELLGM